MFVIPPPATPSVAVAGSAQRFPVRRIWCVGRNYRKHAVEMGGDPDRQPPFFFAKPGDAVVDAGSEHAARIAYPPMTQDLHHEVELAVAIHRGGDHISADEALRHVFGYAVSLDLTRRDLQAAAKKAGRPWAFAKGFDASAPLAPLVPGPTPPVGDIWLDINGSRRQSAHLEEMIWRVPEIIAHLSASVRLEPGDLILTGTPAGVGPIHPGDTLTAGIDGLPSLHLTIASETS